MQCNVDGVGTICFSILVQNNKKVPNITSYLKEKIPKVAYKMKKKSRFSCNITVKIVYLQPNY